MDVAIYIDNRELEAEAFTSEFEKNILHVVLERFASGATNVCVDAPTTVAGSWAFYELQAKCFRDHGLRTFLVEEASGNSAQLVMLPN